ncbi:BMC_2a_G0024560.mRNA.1.CDS.1 [Saccharomyces cerevisiae]|nr:Erv29p [Saccharomyces cerevisiae YJM1447]CAI4484653.1 BMB_G0024590.mRNA.1.CDS.1 [Saccharomyces cerevisiae]CAI4485052.1 BMC_2a_G0024560.mRNA.1.CDS.1 [Saccharomyces cerevisiae]CAI7126949.1 BMC_2a_G0024560.mRNA.1.CDS.1 [Saccharomyces cerevisiae]CAI7129446.1 BMB_G0024590.mRNA.1.CDS.1 [Saccharomyces cerevisiae]
MSYRGPTGNFGGMSMSSSQGPYSGGAQFRSNQNQSTSGILKQWKHSFEKFASRIEGLTDNAVVYKLKPYIPSLSRFFIVATFYEDSFRILSQWSDQIFYLNKWKHYPYFFVVVFLVVVTVSMLIGASLLVLRKQTNYATGVLCTCVISQALVYGLFTGSSFVLRNFSVIGGLLIAFSDSIVQNKTTFGMLPELNSKNDKAKGYLLFAGRILIVLMFIAFTFSKSWFTVVLTIIGTICFAIGYKTKFASIMLGLILTFYNITLNNYWFYNNTKRDFLKYEFYQNLSIIGGLLLVTNTGAGELSVDEKKKIY